MKNTLNVGSGERTYKEYPLGSGFTCINFDARPIEGHTDLVGDVRKLPWTDNYFEYILASDIIEHLKLSEVPSVLNEWARVLKKGGVIEFRTPDMAWAAKHYQENKDAKFVSYHIFGGQDYPGNFHYVMFDVSWLTSLCSDAGLTYLSDESAGSNFILKVIK
jgi:predicted SAM-dependent methyltransferase